MKKISIVSPAWNEAENLPVLCERLLEMAKGLPQYEWEIIISENGSKDESWEILQRLHADHPEIKAIRLSRNFMADGGVMAGLRLASGDAVIIMNADLQDPPELIPEFIEKWEQGFQIVYGVIEKREGEPIWKKSISAVYYKFVNWLTNDLIPRDVTDFRLIDRRVAIAMNRLGENNRFTRAMSVWSGFSVAGVKFIRPPRYAGESKAPLGDLIEEGLNGIFSFSVAPLRLTLFTGFMFALITVVFGIYQLLATVLWGANFPGYLTLVFINLIVASLLFTMLGIYGEYLAKIFLEVKGRPNFIIWDTVGLAPPTIAEMYDDPYSHGRAAHLPDGMETLGGGPKPAPQPTEKST